jgi:hypothetical protein
MRFLGGYLPSQGDVIEFMQSERFSGNFAQIHFPEVAPGFEAGLVSLSPGKTALRAGNNTTPGSGATITLENNPTPNFTQVSLDGAQLTVTWSTQPGRRYRLEASDDLSSSVWTPVTELLDASDSSLSATLGAEAAPRRFYRVASVEQ